MKQRIREFPYNNKECYMFTRSSIQDTEDVKFVNDDVTEFVGKLKRQDGKNIWIVGRVELLHSFHKKNWWMKSIITVAPTIIGNGIPLFKER